MSGDDAAFKALADPTRRRILDVLYERNGQSLSDIEAERDSTQAATASTADATRESAWKTIVCTTTYPYRRVRPHNWQKGQSMSGVICRHNRYRWTVVALVRQTHRWSRRTPQIDGHDKDAYKDAAWARRVAPLTRSAVRAYRSYGPLSSAMPSGTRCEN